jgi:hypothetical protein
LDERQRFCEATRLALVEERRLNPMQALKSIRSARRMLPEQATLAVAAGECYDALGDFVRARREYAAAVAIDPALAAPRLRLDEIDRMESAARQMGSAMLETEALRGWLATPAHVSEAAEANAGAGAALATDVDAAVDATALPEKNGARGCSVVLHPNVLSSVSRDGDPMVVLVAPDSEAGGAGGSPRAVVNLDNLVRQALTEALDDPTWLSVR